jgi:nitrous oxidase accessory protein NosD
MNIATMKRLKIFLLLVAAIAFLSPSLVLAQATRTWISGVGDDANPGSRTAPCKTFAGAISQTAPGGVIDILDPGGFGGVTIAKSITLEGDGAEGDVLVSGTAGIVVNAGTNDIIILRNLTLEGLGATTLTPGTFGIRILQAGSVHIENCRINGFSAATGAGIELQSSAATAQLYIKDTTIHNCFPAGIRLDPTVPCSVLIEHVNITDCGNGIVVSSNATAVINDTTVSGNAGVGFLVGTNGYMTVNRGTATDNQIGVAVLNLGYATISDCTITKNTDGVAVVKPGKLYSLGDNSIFGNLSNGSASITGLVTKK